MQLLKTYLVEDSAVIRHSLVATLEELAPVEVVGTAEDEESAVKWLTDADHHTDLVIIDIFLKNGSGLGVLRRIQTLRKSTKLVVLTNYATGEMRNKCFALGVDQVFDKSREIDALLAYCGQAAGSDAANY